MVEKKQIPRWHRIVGWVLTVFGSVYLFEAVLFGLELVNFVTTDEAVTNDAMAPSSYAPLFISFGLFFISWGVLLVSGIISRLRQRPRHHWIIGIIFTMFGVVFCPLAVIVPQEMPIAVLVMAIILTLIGVYYLFGIADFVRRYFENRNKEILKTNGKTNSDDEMIIVGLSKDAK